MFRDNRKQLVLAERKIRCRRTGVLITSHIEIDEERVPPVVEFVTMETPPVQEPRP